KKINEDVTIKGYCRNGDCKTNEDGINALTAYIIMEFKRSIKTNEFNKYDECLLMWLSDKLLKMYYDSKGQNVRKGFVYLITLNQAYDKYLKNHKVMLDYWTLFDNIKGLKEANLKYMSEFYKLLNNICKTIADYKDNGAGSRKLSKYSKNCLNQYRILYNNISECKSYLRLLNKLKGIYDDFRNYAIQENSSKNDLETKLKKLTREDGVEMDAVRGFKTYEISKKKCNSLDKKKTKPPKADKSPLQPSNQQKGGQKETPPAHKPETKQQSSTESAPQSPQVPASNIQIESPGSQGRSDGASDPLPTQGVKSQNSDDGQNNPAGNSDTTKNQADISSVQDKAQENNPTTPENTDQENIQKSDIPDTGNTGDKLKGSEPISQDKQVHQPPEDENPPKESGSELKDDVKELDKPPIDTDSQDGSNPEPQNKQDETDTPTSTEDNHDVFNWSILIKYGNLFVNRIKEYREPVTNSLHYIRTNLYDYTWSTLNQAYNTFREYSENINIMDYFKVESKPNKLKDSETPGNEPQSKEDKEEPPPSLPDPEQKEPQDTQPPTPTDQRNDNSQEQHSIEQHDQTGSGQENPSDSPPEKQSQTSVGSSSDTHSTETGSKDLGTNVEEKTPQLVNSINIFKGYNRPEIAITILLIPIISLIIYKYLSFGRRNELKKKKKMKKAINMVVANKTTKTVINSSDGKKQVKIIIKSSSQKKQTKKSINSANRKKLPSLNIYQLMQADPVPFINLFFLLIFFVYKRKRDFIE
ncbi:CIR protein, partial [Plasmodium chabaudi adami]